MSPPQEDLFWNAFDIAVSPVSSLDKYVAKGAITRGAATVLSPAAWLGEQVGKNNPQMRANAKVIRTEVVTAFPDFTPEGLFVAGLDIAAPGPEMLITVPAKAAKAIKIATEARKVSLLSDAIKMIAKPATVTRFVDVASGAAKSAPKVIDTLATVGNKARVTLTSGGTALSAVQAAAHWDEVAKVAAAAKTANAAKALKTIEAYRTAAAQVANVRRATEAAGVAVRAADAAAALRKAGTEARAVSTIISAGSKVAKDAGLAARAVGAVQDVVGSTVKSAKTAWPYVAAAGVGAAGLGGVVGLYLLTGPKDVALTNPNPTPVLPPIDPLAKGDVVGGDEDVPLLKGGGGMSAGSGEPDWNKIISDALGAPASPDGGGLLDYPMGELPSEDVLSDDPGFLDTTGMPLLDAPLDVINGGLDSIGLDSDFAEGLREAMGMGPVMALAVLAAGTAATYVIADKTGFLSALKDFEIGDLGVGHHSSGGAVW